MKIIYLTAVIAIALVISIFPQKKFGRDGEMRERMAQLEKIKLIEVMNMDEETTLRFFSRRSEFLKKHDEMRDNIDGKIDQLEATLKSARMVTESELQNMINEILELHLAFENKRAEFVRSLNDILSTDQIARYVVFEKRFKDELRRLLLHDRKPRKQE
jgi:hypothetical protein